MHFHVKELGNVYCTVKRNTGEVFIIYVIFILIFICLDVLLAYGISVPQQVIESVLFP